MEEVCPACNGLYNLSASCPRCGEPMTDAGSVNDYFGPYSPYMDEDSLNLRLAGSIALPEEEQPLPCVHLITCPRCGWDTRVPVNPVRK